VNTLWRLFDELCRDVGRAKRENPDCVVFGIESWNLIEAQPDCGTVVKGGSGGARHYKTRGSFSARVYADDGNSEFAQ
jgi:hypothetical protein